MIIIGISGKKGAGKDEVCKMIMQHFPDVCVRIAFADALKEEVSRALIKPISYIEEHKDNFRLILQGWGTDYRRKLSGDDYWIRQWINKLRNTDKKVIITPDVRFLNEAITIRQLKGYLFRVERRCVDTQDQHQSETSLDNYHFDHIIDNNGTLSQLHVNVDIALEMFGLSKKINQ